MFYTLHRILKVSIWMLIALLLVWLYRQREALEPLWVWYDVYDNGGIQNRVQLPRIEGKGINIYDGHTFQLESSNRYYNVRLTGFASPEPPLSGDELQRELRRREVLKEHVFMKPVSVDITYSNQNSYLGIVYANGTNLNLLYLTNDLSRFKPEFVKSTPRDVQYRFFSAVRWHKKQAHEKGAEVALHSE